MEAAAGRLSGGSRAAAQAGKGRAAPARPEKVSVGKGNSQVDAAHGGLLGKFFAYQEYIWAKFPDLLAQEKCFSEFNENEDYVAFINKWTDCSFNCAN